MSIWTNEERITELERRADLLLAELETGARAIAKLTDAVVNIENHLRDDSYDQTPSAWRERKMTTYQHVMNAVIDLRRHATNEGAAGETGSTHHPGTAQTWRAITDRAQTRVSDAVQDIIREMQERVEATS